MSATLQTESPPTEVPQKEGYTSTTYTVIGLLLVMVLIWVTVKGKLRDWFIR